MEFTIRNGRKEDMPAVMALIQELADFENEPNEVEVTVKDLEGDGFGDNALFNCFVAETNGKIIGLALVYGRYSTWKGPAVHLEDLIVSKEFRGLGIGAALLDEVVKYAHKKKVRRLGWEVLDWNKPAIEFYESRGAKILETWRVVQMDEKGIENYLNK